MTDKIKRLFLGNTLSLTRKWLLSYILILVIPLITNLFSQVYSYVKLKEELIQSNTNLTAQINSELDRLFSNAQRMAGDVAHTAAVQKLLQVEGQSNVNMRDIYKMTLEIEQTGTYREATGAYFIYLPAQEYVIMPTSVVTLKEYHQIKGITTEYAVWKKQIEEGNGWQSYGTASGGEFCFVRQVQENGARGSVGSIMTPTELSHVVNEYIDNSDIFIYDQNGNNSISLGTVQQNRDITGIGFTEISGVIPFGNRTAVYRKMSYTSFYLVYAISNDVFWGQVYSVIVSFLLSVLFCLIIGFAASYYLAKKNIEPVRQIAQLLSTESDRGNQVQEDYQYIYQAIAGTLESRRDIKQQLERQNGVLKEIQLRKLLNGQVEAYQSDQISFQEQLQFVSQHFLVCILYIEDFEEGMDSPTGQDSFQEIYDIMVGIISGALEKAFASEGTCYVVQENGVMTVLLNFSQRQTQPETKMHRLLLEFCEEIYTKYHITLSIYAGDVQQSLGGIAASYQHALTTMEKGVLMSRNEVTWYDDIRDEEVAQYYYPLDKEHFMISALKEGDFAGASIIFEQIWGANFAGGTDNPYGKWIVSNLANILMKTALDIEVKNEVQFAADLHLERLTTSGQHPNILHDDLSNAIDKICKMAKAFDKTEEDTSLSERISEYVMENYQDQNLSINMLGEKFELTPHYLSKLFKEQTGKALLDFIHLVRLEHAKTMLAERKETVEEIAIQVGYTNRVTFTRAFKKYFGMTPGKYLEMI